MRKSTLKLENKMLKFYYYVQSGASGKFVPIPVEDNSSRTIKFRYKKSERNGVVLPKRSRFYSN